MLSKSCPDRVTAHDFPFSRPSAVPRASEAVVSPTGGNYEVLGFSGCQFYCNISILKDNLVLVNTLVVFKHVQI